MHASLAHVTEQYRIEKRDHVRYLEEYLADKSQYQVFELNREHERWLCKVTNNQAEEMINYELFCEVLRNAFSLTAPPSSESAPSSTRSRQRSSPASSGRVSAFAPMLSGR